MNGNLVIQKEQGKAIKKRKQLSFNNWEAPIRKYFGLQPETLFWKCEQYSELITIRVGKNYPIFLYPIISISSIHKY